MIEPRDEHAARLAHQPGLRHVAQLLRRGGVWQADVQHARAVALGQHGAAATVLLARIEHQRHRLAQKGQGGAFLPVDAVGFDARVPLARLTQLGDDPALFFAQRGLDFVQRRPARRAHGQAVGADRKADGAPLAPLKLVVHAGVCKVDGAVGARVRKVCGHERIAQRHRRFVRYQLRSCWRLFLKRWRRFWL